jgi:hypothetical protein
MNTEESTKVACVVVSVKDFLRWGINIGSKLCAKPHKKNRQVINIKGIIEAFDFCIAS